MSARITWPAVLAGTTLLADLAVLVWVGATPAQLAIGTLFLAACTSCGTLFLRGREGLFPDRASLLAVAAAFGLALHMGLAFVAFHARLEAWLGIPTRRAAACIVFGLLCLLALAALPRLRRGLASLRWFAFPGAASVVFALASLVAGSAHFGFGNDVGRGHHTYGDIESGHTNTVVAEFLETYRSPDYDPAAEHPPEWGGRIDSLWYVWLIPRMVDTYGLPGIFWNPKSDGGMRLGQFQHVWVAVQVTALTDTAGKFGAEGAALASKVLVLAWVVLVAWMLFLIARTLLDVSTPGALLAVAGGLFYASLNLSVLDADYPTRASHLLTSVSGPIHWNLNQLAHLAVGLCGLYLVLSDLARPRGFYALGCLLIAATVYLKPSLYFVAVPGIGLASLRLGRGFFRADVLLGWAAILAAAGFWHLYPRAIGLTAITSPIDLGFLELQQEATRGMRLMPETWLQRLSIAQLKALIVLCAYAALVLPALVLARDLFAGGEKRRRILAAAARPHVLALLLIFAWGAFSGACFMEENERRTHFNFFFGGAAAYVCFLPLLVRAIERIEKPAVRACAWLIYAAHLASGIVNLSIYVRTGSLV